MSFTAFGDSLILGACLVVSGSGHAHAQIAQAGALNALGAETQKYVRVPAGRVVLEHVRVIDGTGGPARGDQNVTIEGGRIAAISAGASIPAADGTTIIDFRGHSVLPGIVGMHDHVFYQARPNLRDDNSTDGRAFFLNMSFSAPRLYLAAGVTTIRTAGSAAPNADLQLRRMIDEGTVPGPHMDVTGPYLDGLSPAQTMQTMPLAGPTDARQTVAFWAEHGVTSFKVYQNITRAELRAVIDEAHSRGLKVTGHLCSVTYPEAIELGIDNLEHGFSVNTALDPDKTPDTCSASAGDYTLEHAAAGTAEATRLIASLVAHHVAITSTLPLRAASVPGMGHLSDGSPIRAAELDAMSPSLRAAYELWYEHPSPTRDHTAALVRGEMALERAFDAAGGLLLAGPDPVGLAGVLPGFGDQREIELLVEAGFSPVEAIRIATLNGAIFLGCERSIGSIEVGKNADLLVVRGDPSARIADIENVALVFKDGVGYDSAKLLASVKGHYGEY
jgi:imidazolonepropionase-like amidohydrolase